MRTTLREKAVLWANGLAIAGGLELIAHLHLQPLSPAGLALIVPFVGLMALFTTWMLRQR